jgi:ribonuclease D
MEIETDELHLTKEELSALPVEKYTKQIIVINTEKEADEVVKHLSRFKVVGIDTETRPSFRKGDLHKVALIQLATEECTYLFRINRTGITASLKKLFENESVTKIGLSLKDDFMVLRRMEPSLRFVSFIELQNLVQKFNIKNKGLRGLYGVLFGKKISKGQRLSNWEADELSVPQKEYAALDAWATLQIYICLMKRGMSGIK